jgi:biopolymer transport protein ExbD
VDVRVAVEPNGACALWWHDEKIAPEYLGERARRFGTVRDVRVVADRAVPYRCIGGVIFTLQHAGVARVTLLSEPPGDTPFP